MFTSRAASLLVVIGIASAAARTQDDLALKLGIDNAETAEVRPGAVMLLTVSGSRPLTFVEADAFKRSLSFWTTADGTVQQTLVGVPLDVAPGSHELSVRARDANGRGAAGRLLLTAVAAKFETRRLRVDPRFVNPPPSEAERIAREARRLAEIFAQTTPIRQWSGPFVPPVPGQPTSSFGRLTILNGASRTRHLGTDFRAAEGTPVVAPNAGTVAIADDYYFSGRTVILDHGDGLYSLLGHFSRIEVTAGARVQRGDRLGDSGSTGRVTGPHLHWAVRLHGDSVDPLSLMAAVASAYRPPGGVGARLGILPWDSTTLRAR